MDHHGDILRPEPSMSQSIGLTKNVWLHLILIRRSAQIAFVGTTVRPRDICDLSSIYRDSAQCMRETINMTVEASPQPQVIQHLAILTPVSSLRNLRLMRAEPRNRRTLDAIVNTVWF